jgi:phospholipase/carboxylesterase
MMSLYVAPRRPEPVAGVVGFSGRLIPGDDLAAEAVSKPPVLLVHGDQDEMINVSEMSTAETALRGAGFDVQSHVSRGIGHGIAPDGLSLALGFLARELGIAPG